MSQLNEQQRERLANAVKPNIIEMMNPEHDSFAGWMYNGKGNAAVNSNAGTGKTWMGANIGAPIALELGSQRILYCCFGKKNQQELAEVLPKGVDARTIHSLARGAVWVRHRNEFGSEPDHGKYYKIIRSFLRMPEQHGASEGLTALIESKDVDIQTPATKLCDFVRSQLADPTDDRLSGIARHFDIDLPGSEEAELFCFEIVRKALEKGFAQIPLSWDFADLLWKCAKDGYRPKQFDWIFCDEAQDFSPAQLRVAQLACKRNGRMVFIGDPNQAIMGFAGADHRSFERIVEKMNCEELSLSVCWRCPTSHLDMARTIVPSIQNAPGAILGEISSVKYESLGGKVKEGDMVICRTNSPLVALCFELIAEGVPARVIGRDIGKGLIAAARKIADRKDFKGWARFGKCVDSWEQRLIERLKSDDVQEDDARIQSVNDRAKCLKIIWNMGNCRTLKSFTKTTEGLFSDDRPGVALSSVHRSKGLEAYNVYIMKDELLGQPPWCIPGSWQHQQELNLQYVAYTRSKYLLSFVTGTP